MNVKHLTTIDDIDEIEEIQKVFEPVLKYIIEGKPHIEPPIEGKADKDDF